MIYLEDAFMDHPKMVAVGDEGIVMWLRGIQWLKEQRSHDGRIPKAVVHRHCVPVIRGKPLPSEPIMRRLIEVGSWHDEGASVVVHGYTERNESSIRRSEAGKRNAEKRWEKRRMADAIPSSAHANGIAGGSGVADAYSPQPTAHVNTPSLDHQVVATAGSGDVPGLLLVEALLRKVCPPDKARLFGAPRAELIRVLQAGADLELVLAAIRQGDRSEGAFIRTQRAMSALADGKLPGGPGGAVLNEEGAEKARQIVREEPPSPATTQKGLAECRAVVRRQA